MATVPTLFLYIMPPWDWEETGNTQSMENRTNNAFELRLNNDDGVLLLSGLLIDTMVYLYDDQGNLKAKEQCVQQAVSVQLPSRGVYVLILFHPICEVVVRRFRF